MWPCHWNSRGARGISSDLSAGTLASPFTRGFLLLRAGIFHRLFLKLPICSTSSWQTPPFLLLSQCSFSVQKRPPFAAHTVGVFADNDLSWWPLNKYSTQAILWTRPNTGGFLCRFSCSSMHAPVFLTRLGFCWGWLPLCCFRPCREHLALHFLKALVC